MGKNLYINYFSVLLFFNVITSPGTALIVVIAQFEIPAFQKSGVQSVKNVDTSLLSSKG